MNLSHANSVATAWKRTRLHHVTAVAGVALAITAVLVMGGLGTLDSAGRSVTEPAIQAPRADSAVYVPRVANVVFYIVETGQEARAIETAVNEFALYGRDTGEFSFAVLSTNTPAGRVAAEHVTTGGIEEIGGGASVKVVDLR